MGGCRAGEPGEKDRACFGEIGMRGCVSHLVSLTN